MNPSRATQRHLDFSSFAGEKAIEQKGNLECESCKRKPKDIDFIWTLNLF